jgi:hypothetical protein
VEAVDYSSASIKFQSNKYSTLREYPIVIDKWSKFSFSASHFIRRGNEGQFGKPEKQEAILRYREVRQFQLKEIFLQDGMNL